SRRAVSSGCSPPSAEPRSKVAPAGVRRMSPCETYVDDPSRTLSVPQADAVFDDEVVEIRVDSHQDLAEDVHGRHVFRADRGGPARAGCQEERAILVGDHDLDRE